MGGFGLGIGGLSKAGGPAVGLPPSMGELMPKMGGMPSPSAMGSTAKGGGMPMPP